MSDTGSQSFDKGLLAISDEDFDALLAESYPCVLSIPRKDKGPLATPVWYRWHDRKIVMGFDRDSFKGKLVARHGCATITVQRPVEPYQYVMIEGEARFLSDEELAAKGETVWSYFLPVIERYLDKELAGRYIKMLPVLAPGYGIVEITPRVVRGEDIPRHEDIIPSEEELDELLASMQEGETSTDAVVQEALSDK